MEISIVIPSYNQGAYIGRTLDSILSQKGDFVLEVIVFDGGSTDNICDILQTYKDKIFYISEKDKGQSDAINKGFRKATGDIIAWLNSDDIYYGDTLKKISEKFASDEKIKWLYGGYRMIDAQDKTLREFRGVAFSFATFLNYDYIPQPSTFWRREVFERIGFVNTDLHLAMDYDYFLRMASEFPTPFVFAEPLSALRVYPDAKSSKFAYRQLRETYELAYRYTAEFSPQRFLQYIYKARGFVSAFIRNLF